MKRNRQHRSNETGRAADENWQGRERELPVPAMGTGRAAEGNSPDEHSALETNQTRPSYGRAGWSLENEIETTPSAIPSEQGRGEGTTDPQERLCEDFLAAWAPVLGDALVQTYRSEEAKWRAAAGRLLERHSVERLHNGFAGMLEDEIVGSRATTLPQFEKVVDQLIVRRHARRQQRSAVGGLPTVRRRLGGRPPAPRAGDPAPRTRPPRPGARRIGRPRSAARALRRAGALEHPLRPANPVRRTPLHRDVVRDRP